MEVNCAKNFQNKLKINLILKLDFPVLNSGSSKYCLMIRSSFLAEWNFI